MTPNGSDAERICSDAPAEIRLRNHQIRKCSSPNPASYGCSLQSMNKKGKYIG
jgi:hypothetical protein